MKTTITSSGALESLLDDLIAAELTLLDGLIDTDNILPDNTTSTNVQMANLGVAHETLGKTDGDGGSLELGVTVGVLVEGVHDGSVGIGDGITILGALC